MKTLTGVIALVLALMFGTSNGVIAAEQKSQPTGVKKIQPATGEKEAVKGKAAIYKHEITGKVTGVDLTAKTFIIMIQGKAITFSAANLSKLPTVGKMIDITYTWNPGEPPMATSTTDSGSEEERQTGYEHCGNYHCCPVSPFYTLNLKGGCPD